MFEKCKDEIECYVSIYAFKLVSGSFDTTMYNLEDFDTKVNDE